MLEVALDALCVPSHTSCENPGFALYRYHTLMTVAAGFAPFQTLAENLMPHAMANRGDGSHDTSHLQRVWKNADSGVNGLACSKG
jgi:hypothetical protein